MIKSARDIAVLGTMVAVMIAGQLVLGAIAGIEIITVLLATYCFINGPLKGVIVATVFSLVRCLVFGFFPQVIILYLIYYNLFALILGLLGRVCENKKTVIKILLVTVIACALTLCFTLLDNFLSIYVFKMFASDRAIKIYLAQSMPVALTQVISNAVIIPLLFIPLVKVFELTKTKREVKN